MEQNGTGLQKAIRKKEVPGRLREKRMRFHISQHCSESYSPEPSLLCPCSHYVSDLQPDLSQFLPAGGEGVSAALLCGKKKKKKSNYMTHFHSFISKEYNVEASVTTVSLTQLIYKDCQVIRLLDFLRLQKKPGSPRWAHVP